jgi:hypothetical protein
MRCQISLPVTHQQRELGLSNKYVTNQKKSNLDEKFDSRVEKRKTDVNKIVDLLKTTNLTEIFADELLLIIAEFACPEREYDLYVVFQRKKFWNRDTYYIFSGTKTRLDQSLFTLQEEGRREGKNDLVDVPFVRPLQWTFFTFDIKSQYDKCVENIVKNGHKSSASGMVKICDIGALPICYTCLTPLL